MATLAATLSLGACAGVIQSASISEAYKQFELEQYERTLEMISQAENIKAVTDETKAELTYLKARTLGRLGRRDISRILYQYLAQEHGNSQYGYLAVEQLKVE